MKLRDFITTVLVDIEQGVNNAAIQTNRVTYLNSMDPKGSEGVEFDVAVTANAEASGKVGAEVFNFGAKTEGKISQEEISRIKFVVKVGSYYPKK